MSGQLFPDGATPVVKPFGASQVRALRDLEARASAMQKTGALRARRDAAREDFLDVFADIAGRVRSAYPRNRAMHEVFFDRISGGGGRGRDDDDDPADDGDDASPAPPA